MASLVFFLNNKHISLLSVLLENKSMFVLCVTHMKAERKDDQGHSAQEVKKNERWAKGIQVLALASLSWFVLNGVYFALGIYCFELKNLYSGSVFQLKARVQFKTERFSALLLYEKQRNLCEALKAQPVAKSSCKIRECNF